MTSDSHPQDVPPQLRLLTYNAWGLKFIAKHRHARLSEIGRLISQLDPAPNIVALQECWTQQDYLSIAESCKKILPYAKFYWSGIFGGGLAILSKWPITESNMYRYPLNGRPTAFFRGDWYVGKGVACAKIEVSKRELGMLSSTSEPNGGDDDDEEEMQTIEVFCTHLHAPYEREPNDSYICHRTAQAWEIAKLMRGAAERGNLVLGMGDFNMLPLSFAHRVITAHAPVEDAWRVIYPESSIGPSHHPAEKARKRAMPTVKQSLTYEGHSCDSVSNTWRWGEERQKRHEKGEDIVVSLNEEDPKAKRLDYIFVGDGQAHITKKRRHQKKISDNATDSSIATASSPRTWKVTEVSLELTQRHSTLKCSLSDHYAVCATLSFLPHSSHLSSSSSSSSIHAPPPHTSTGSLSNPRISADVSADGEKGGVAPLNAPLSSLYPPIIGLIDTYNIRERKQRKWRLTHFVTSVFVSIACFIGIWWVPHNGVAFLLCLVSSLGLGAGVIDGLIGGLFVGSEIRALKEFEWEVRNEMAREERSGKGKGVNGVSQA